MTIPVWFQYWYNNGSGGIAAAAQTYIDRVEADGGAVESIGCVPSAVWDWTAPLPLLDLFPNAAAAYSLRKLRTSYSGNAIRVRKEVSAVSSETDIGFLADGSLDTVSLLAFASDADSGDVFVVTWYDQSLSNDATQSTGANQPKIVSGGSLVADVNGKPALSLDGVNNFMTLTLQLSTPLSLFAVINEDGTNSFPYVFGNSVGSLDDILALGFIKSGTEVRNFISGTNAYTDANYTGRHLWTSIIDSSNSFLGKDGVLGTATNNAIGTSIRTQLNLFRSTAAITTMSGTAQELILYGSNQSANRTAIETNINTFYSIYP